MIVRSEFATAEALAASLAQSVAGDLQRGIAARGVASLAVSGGSTPARFFSALSARDEIDWRAVTVTLVDERWVDGSSERSNARLVQQNLLQGSAASAQFVPLFTGGTVPDEAKIADVNRLQGEVPHPFDAVVLGMGGDGHTASFFPGGDTLDAALTGAGPALAIHAPGAGEARVTLTLPYLCATRGLYLHIEGAQKALVLDAALGEGAIEEMPVRAALRQTVRDVRVFWCP